MIAKTLILCSTCLVLAGCVTDKISMSSEVGGDGTGASLRSTGVSSIIDGDDGIGGGNGPVGSTGGLGVTGDNGVVANIVGEDPLGGVLDGALGKGNIVSQILGSSDGTKGLVPALAAGAAGDPDADILNGGLGVSGEDGLIADLTGSDFGGAVLGTQGVIPAGLAGGNDGLLGALLGNHVASPVLGPVAQAVPTSALVSGLAQVPALGVTGQGGVVASVLGADLVGNLIGSGGILGGGGTGAIGSQIPQGSAPLAPLGGAVVTALNTVAGNTQSPLAGTGLGTVLSSLPGGFSSVAAGGGGATGALASVPVVSSVVGGNTGSLTTTVGSVLAPVTQAVATVPVLGGLLAGNK